MENNKLLLAILGMPGSGKSETVSYLKRKGIPFVRFGALTEEELIKARLPVTPENEHAMREKLREEYGMAIYAVKAEPKIRRLLEENSHVAIDGLYSWEEYTYLKEKFPELILLHVFTEPAIRYQRLVSRSVRPFSLKEARKRDIAEIENLHKGGPIAIADCVVTNNTSVADLHKQLDVLLDRLRKGERS